MKNKLLLYVAAVFILSSCAGKLGITKRRYTKGYFVSHQSGKHSVKKDPIATPNKKDATTIDETISSFPLLADAVKPEINTAEPVANKPASELNANMHPARHHHYAPVVALATPELKKDRAFKPLVLPMAKAAQRKRASDNGVKLVVMVILCLFPFINLIPVYIHDGDFTLNFLVTLLLDFTLIGGIIFSLLVVLDVVDLK